MADLPPPEMIRQPTGDVVNVNNTQGLNTLSIGGKTYQILDVGYLCGNISCSVLSEFTCLISPAPYCSLCPSCWHVEGKSYVPDWESCGVPAGLYGMLVKFKPAWMCKCLKQLGYVSADVNLIQQVGTSAICGAPSIPPPLHNFNPFPALIGAGVVGGLAIAGIALAGQSGSDGNASGNVNGTTGGSVAGGVIGVQALNSATLPNGDTLSFDSDGAGVPFRPGIDSDIDDLPIHPAETLIGFGEGGCSNEQPENIKVDYNGACDTESPSNPPNGSILTIPKIV